MSAVSSTRFKTSKSRIPVIVRNKNSSNVNSREKNVNNIVPKIQTTNFSKASNVCLSRKQQQKVSNVQPAKSDKAINGIKSSKPKGNAQLSARSNIKSNCIKEKELPVRTNVKFVGYKEKHLQIKPKSDISKEKDFSSLKSNLKCLYNEKGKVSTSKTASKCSESIEKLSIPKITLEKENQSPSMNCFSAQKDIKFEANEVYRNMILSGRHPSPSVCNLLPGLRMSSILSERPSIYQKFEIPPDPFKEAMQAIENMSLSVKKRKAEKEHKVASPFKDRGSFYTPCTDPKIEVMKGLRELKLKRLQKSAPKSTKKVTFDLNVKECTPKPTSDTQLKSFKNSDSRLTLINEKSEENTPNSPENSRVEASVSKENIKTILNTENDKSDKNSLCPQEMKVAVAVDKIKKDICEIICESPMVYTSVSKLVPSAMQVNSQTSSTSQSEKLVFHSLKETLNVSPDLIFDNKQILDEISTKNLKNANCQTLEQKNLNNETSKITQAKLYTPRPFSLYSKYKVMNSSSPEFLEKGAAETLLKSAPICTPLVLRSVAKSSTLSPNIDLSPVRLNLDFTEKETPRNGIPKKSVLVTCGNIVTSKNKLDELADEECSSWFLNNGAPILYGRYLTDPVALTLNEGDEMHFIPISF